MKTIIRAEVRFPEFNINEFIEDFENWKSENHMGQFGQPRKPVKPVYRQSIAKQMMSMPNKPAHPIMQSTPDKPVKPKDNRDDYIKGYLKKETIELLCPRPRRPLASHKFESIHVDRSLLREFDYSFKYHLDQGPEVLLREYKDVLKEIAKKETPDNYFVFWQLNQYLDRLTYFVDNMDTIIRNYADRIYSKKIKEYEKALDNYREHSPQKNKERYQRELEQYYLDYQKYQKDAAEFKEKLEYGGHVTEEYYLDSLQLYNDNLWIYKQKKHKYGPEKLTVEDFLIITYVWPEIQSDNIFLKDGRQYTMPEYVRGNKAEDLKFTQKWGSHLEAYREFLNMNPHISKQVSGKYSVRTTDSRWNFKTFIKAWVLSYYTELYDELMISEE